MTIQYQPVTYVLDWGLWVCQHAGDTETVYETIDSLTFSGEAYQYEAEYEICSECKEEL